jgi:hypothetical protein
VIAARLAAAPGCLGASTASAGLEDEDVSLTLDPASVNVDTLFAAVLASGRVGPAGVVVIATSREQDAESDQASRHRVVHTVSLAARTRNARQPV